MTVTVTVLYPNVSNATFDIEYYMMVHMPLVQEHWGPQGCKNWKVSRIISAPSGGEPLYTMQCVMEFDTKEQVDAVVNAGGVVMDDVDNFSSVKPISIVGEIVGAWN